MSATIKGIYSNGQIVLQEPPPTDHTTEVWVTFPQEADASTTPVAPVKQRKAGFAKGTFLYIAPDFNEPLEDLKDYM